LDNVAKVMSDPNFNEKKIGTQSQVAKFLCVWCISIVDFNRIYRFVNPLEIAKNAAIEELE